MAIVHYLIGDNASSQKLRDAIARDKSFGHLWRGWFDTGAVGWVVQDHLLPLKLVAQILEGGDPDQLLDAARSFAASGKLTVDFYVALGGAQLTRTVFLGHGLDLVPWSAVPDGVQKKLFTDASDPLKQVGADFPSSRLPQRLLSGTARRIGKFSLVPTMRRTPEKTVASRR